MSWDKEYAAGNRLWGEEPSVLGIAAVSFLSTCPPAAELKILDIGCGYGRDALYLAGNLPAQVLGIDTAEKAIEIAKESARKEKRGNAEFLCLDFRKMTDGGYDVVFISNLYQLLRAREREELRNTVSLTLRPGGSLFLSTLSVSDPEHRGQGAPIAGEENSIDIGKYLHLCTRIELMNDFSFLDIKELKEHEYDEPRSTGKPHHHISWIVRATQSEST